MKLRRDQKKTSGIAPRRTRINKPLLKAALNLWLIKAKLNPNH